MVLLYFHKMFLRASSKWSGELLTSSVVVVCPGDTRPSPSGVGTPSRRSRAGQGRSHPEESCSGPQFCPKAHACANMAHWELKPGTEKTSQNPPSCFSPVPLRGLPLDLG